MAIILASQSPRRQELLKKIRPEFKTVPAFIDETIKAGVKPVDYVEEMAMKKANNVAKQYPDDLVIGCDTIVALETTILGKPVSKTEAFQMLEKLSGRAHQVHTSVVVMKQQDKKQVTISSTVKFYTLTAEEINGYLETKEYEDKAGGYGIQGQGALFVEQIQGDYYAIMGLPIARLSRLLLDFEKMKEGNAS